MTNFTNDLNDANSGGGGGGDGKQDESSAAKSIEVEQVGFSSLPEQVHRKSIKKGFEFTILVVGDSGLGKSTLVNSLFMTDLYADRTLDTVTDKIKKTVGITKRTAELEEKGVRLKLTVVDTPGFGDSINAHNSWKTIVDYVEDQFYSYYIHESGYGIDRKKLQDARVHCCLYFIPSHVRGLRPIDVEAIRSLQDKVNIVPVIGKADSLTKKEIETLKQNILFDIERFQLKIYEFPQCDSDDDETFKQVDNEIKNAIPFALIGSNTIMESGTKRIRGRVYPWGIVDIESDVCDFNKLRTFICSHMQDLKDLTHDVHYENYRTELIKSQRINKQTSVNLGSIARGGGSSDETERMLKQKEMELRKMHELLTQMKLSISNQEQQQQTAATTSSANGNGHQAQPVKINQTQQQQPLPSNLHNYVNMGNRNYENSSNGHTNGNSSNGHTHNHSNGNTNNSQFNSHSTQIQSQQYHYHHQYQQQQVTLQQPANGYVPTKTSIPSISFVLNASNNSLLNRALNSPIAINANAFTNEFSNGKANGNAHYSNSTPI